MGFKQRKEYESKPLIERNAIRIAELERHWAHISPLRTIIFTVNFCAEGSAKSFANRARREGFDVKILKCAGLFKFNLEATRTMEPTASNITSWQRWFQEQVSVVPDFEHEEGYLCEGARFLGWNYPKMLTPTFFLKGDRRTRHDQNASGAEDRTRVLFGQAPCEFEASNGWSSNNDRSKSSSTFQLLPSSFIKLATQRKPCDPEPTASNFSQWLYSLYSNTYGDADDRVSGIAAEEAILGERRRAYSATDYHTMRLHFSDWYLKHNGMVSNKKDRPNYFAIQNLNVRGQPLSANPDLIYENKRSGEIIIVEIKHSQMHIPDNLWPNIWGQLWCYAQIEELLRAPKVTVIGEVWGDKWYTKEYQYVYLRASVRRNPRATAFDRFFRTLFEIYRDAV